MPNRCVDLTVPTEDDPEADEFYAYRQISSESTNIPCRWGLLDNARTHQDTRDLVFSTLVGIQTLAFHCFGGKIPHLFDEHGLPVLDWYLDLSQESVSEALNVAAPVCKLILYFIRVFGNLRVRYGRSNAVGMVDGVVNECEGVASIVDSLVQYISLRSISAADLENRTSKARKLLLGEDSVLIDPHNVLKTVRDLHANDLCLSNVDFAERPTIHLSPAPLKMLALARMGYLWRTDRESSSLLRAVCGESAEVIGKWEPLTRQERSRLVDAIDAEGNFRVTGTDIWVRRIWGRHTIVRREIFWERLEGTRIPLLGYRSIRSSEQGVLSPDTANVLIWMRDKPEEWADELFNDLFRIKSLGYTPESQEIARAIRSARDRAVSQHGEHDCFDMLFGPIHTGYSFACESSDVGNFARLHYKRCLRVIGPRTLVAGTPLYAVNPAEVGTQSLSSIVEEVSELEPILTDREGRFTPEIQKPWETELMW